MTVLILLVLGVVFVAVGLAAYEARLQRVRRTDELREHARLVEHARKRLVNPLTRAKRKKSKPRKTARKRRA